MDIYHLDRHITEAVLAEIDEESRRHFKFVTMRTPHGHMVTSLLPPTGLHLDFAKEFAGTLGVDPQNSFVAAGNIIRGSTVEQIRFGSISCFNEFGSDFPASKAEQKALSDEIRTKLIELGLL
jgi:hypothetical protein